MEARRQVVGDSKRQHLLLHGRLYRRPDGCSMEVGHRRVRWSMRASLTFAALAALLACGCAAHKAGTPEVVPSSEPTFEARRAAFLADQEARFAEQDAEIATEVSR